MRATICALLLMLGLAPRAAARPPLPWAHIRPVRGSAADLVMDASRRSSIVTALLDSLELTNVVVYVDDGMDEADSPKAYLRFVSYAAGTRYLLVHIDRWRVMPAERAAWLAHELQHALEIADSPWVTDRASLAALYRAIGWEGRTGRFESDRARATGRRVLNQLAGLDPGR